MGPCSCGEGTVCIKRLANATASHYSRITTPRKLPLMYICICNAIRESDLRSAARRQNGDAEALYQRLGHQPRCRQCLSAAQQIVATERSFMAA